MRFQITIKQQSQAVNGKAKYPLYKSTGPNNFDENRGIETLNELIQNGGIKIFCDECQKQITSQTIVVGYEAKKQDKTLEKKKGEQKAKQVKELKEGAIIEECGNKWKEDIFMEDDEQIEGKENIQPEREDGQIDIDDILYDDDELAQQQDSKIQEQQKQDDQAKANEQDQDQEGMQNSEQQESSSEQQQAIIQPLPTKPEPAPFTQKQQSPQITHLYCVGCFSQLQELPESYSIRKTLNFSLNASEWRMMDQLSLLNGLKAWGFGNWQQIKDFMDYNGSVFTVEEIEQHYEEVYLKGEMKELLKCEEPQLDITKLHKPQKRLVEDVMHGYYFNGQEEEEQQNSIQKQIHNSKDKPSPKHKQKSIDKDNTNRLKRQRPAQLSQDHNLNSITRRSSYQNTNNRSSQKRPHSFSNLPQEHEQARNKRQDMAEEGSDGENRDDGNLMEIQLKPKSSGMLLERNEKMGGKGMEGSKGLGRSGHYEEQQNDNTHQNHIQSPNQGNKSSQSLKNNNINPSSSLLPGHNIYSYNPKRKQFQIIEYDYYAQHMLNLLQFSEQDSEEQIQLKIKIIEEYNRRLDERIKRRQFVIEHRLLDAEFMAEKSKMYRNSQKMLEPFRRLVKDREQYYDVVGVYDRLCKVKALTEGIRLVKKKISSTENKEALVTGINSLNIGTGMIAGKIPGKNEKTPKGRTNGKFSQVIDYLNKKKEKKELLGLRAKFQLQNQRKILYRENPNIKPNKKLILSMNENSSTYANLLNYSASSNLPHNPTTVSHNISQPNASVSLTTNLTSSPCHPQRTMISRSQERQRLRSQTNRTPPKQQGSIVGQEQSTNQIQLFPQSSSKQKDAVKENNQCIETIKQQQRERQKKATGNSNNLACILSIDPNSIRSVLTLEEISLIESYAVQQCQLAKHNQGQNNVKKPLILKNYVVKPLNLS